MRQRSSIDPIVIVGQAVRLSGGVDDVASFERLLYEGQAAYGPLPEERFDRSLYFDSQRGRPGKSYTDIGGCVSATPPDSSVERDIEAGGTFDLTHRQFAQVALRCLPQSRLPLQLLARCGIYVGHSGGTDLGGPLAMATLADTALDHLRDLASFRALPARRQEVILSTVAERVRKNRPCRRADDIHFDAYRAASLAAGLLGLGGPREVIDAACASSLLALSHAAAAIDHGYLDAAIVGGATYNNVDNLILFSQSQACSDRTSSPFDRSAGGLISSEGYVAVFVTRQSTAAAAGWPVLAQLCEVGVASDGRGKSLWAPRTEGQQLAIRRGYPEAAPLSVDYLEAHATSTQVGDAAELHSLAALLDDRGSAADKGPLWIGSVKSNLGHTLEAAGLVGLVKVLIALRREQLPPTIHFREPTPDFDWSDGRIRVVTEPIAWQTHDGVRRAAVNAFGIGGLNGHAVIQSPADAPEARGNGRPAVVRAVGPNRLPAEPNQSQDEPIAIVGRGVVLPAAFDVASFDRLLAGETTAIGGPPAERWRGRVGVGQGNSPFEVPTNRGGYINGYRFDGQPYRIPPKQVQRANPLQMMLIDAVRQAAEDAGCLEAGTSWTGDRQRVGVIIGTIFGGEFSNQLQIGLRLPEICRHLNEELQAAGLDESDATSLSGEYRELMLRRYPALLDETGSFTASTLASRIAKTFDLMGGACAVDADDASASLALMLACDQLRAGRLDAVVCGTARRSLDLVGFRDLQLRDQLVSSGRVEDIPPDCARILPGEGVGVVLLKRLSDARRQGMPVLGVLGQTVYAVCSDAEAARREQMAADSLNRRIVQKVGYLAGAHSIIRLIAKTLHWEREEPSRTVLASVASDGFALTQAAAHPDGQLTSDRLPESETQTQLTAQQARVTTQQDRADEQTPMIPTRDNFESVATAMTSRAGEPTHPIRLQGRDAAEFERQLELAISHPEQLFADSSAAGFPAEARFCGGVVAASVDELHKSAEAMLKAWQEGRRTTVLDRHSAVFYDRGSGRDRVTWVFPGQGSQYSAMPPVIREDPQATHFLAAFDAQLAALGLPPVRDRLADEAGELGHDIWWTQLWILAVSATFADSLVRAGLSPDLVMGHSFGECGAAWHAGVMTSQQAIRFAKYRSEAVVMTVRQRGQLLSVRAAPHQVERLLATHGGDLTITHHNAPEQTVVAGPSDAIAELRRVCTEASIAAVVIPVPAAFHTPAMEAARRRLAAALGDERMRPPRCGFFSTVEGRYLAEPSRIRDSLINQLTTPLLYCGAIERVVGDGCGLLLEVGPGDVLTRLHRAIVPDKALCLSLDSGRHDHARRLRLVKLAGECVSSSSLRTAAVGRSVPAPSVSSRGTADMSVADEAPAASVQVVDVTRRARGQTKPADAVDSAAEPAGGGGMPQRSEETVATWKSAEPAFAGNGKPVHAIPAAVSRDRKDVDRFLLDFVVELTGYSAEVIDFEADLEAELGVDSIKKAQIIGELAEWASLQLDLRSMKLADFESLADIRQLALGETVDEQTESAAASEQAISPESLDQLMIDFVVDQTGYSPDIIDVDADLESELGVDSIKKAQLLGELATHFELPDIDLRRLRLADFPTLRSIRDFICRQDAAGGSDGGAKQVSAGAGRPADDSFEQHEPVGQIAKKKMIQRGLRSLIDDPSPENLSRLEANIDESLLTVIRSEGPVSSRLAAVAEASGVAAASLWNFLGRPQARDGEAVESHATSPSVPGPAVESRPVKPSHAAEEYRAEKPSALLQQDSRTKRLQQASVRRRAIPRQGTCRFGLVTVLKPWRDGMPSMPPWYGDAVVVGKNPIAEELVRRLRGQGLTVHAIDAGAGVAEVEAKLGDIWSRSETPHLFLTTPHDRDAAGTVSTAAWQARRNAALAVPFRVCQMWMQRMIDLGMMDRASAASVLNLGGDFGFSATDVCSPESGGLAGLTKAMLIEAWMRGYRETPMKVIDVGSGTDPGEAAVGIFRELAVPSHDEEISIESGSRRAVEPVYLPLRETAEIDWAAEGDRISKVTQGGTWIVSGGGRGITAMTAMALAEKHNLVLHLLGTAPAPELNDPVRSQAASDRGALRRAIMSAAQQRGENPIEAWRDLEKAIEIDRTLRECRDRGIRAAYHQINVADASAVRSLVDRIRSQDGPIRGVIHGAGAGQDARFDRKRPEKVDKCIRAKVDGCIALAEATAGDPLEWFVGFGSISGRFGANGHTDYSLANDMLAKLIDRLRQQRPEVRCLTFHWHAWGDIGMATKPEAKLALEMIGMEFMPANEGLRHFLDEFEFGGDMPEVLITDRNYIRKFFPGFGDDTAGEPVLPLLDPSGSRRNSVGSEAMGETTADESVGVSSDSWGVTLDPVGERFLSNHRVGGRPTLPFVVALEMMAEAVKAADGRAPRACRDVRAMSPLKFSDDQPMAVEIERDGDTGDRTWCLRADLRRRDGRMVEARRLHFRATFPEPASVAMPRSEPFADVTSVPMEPIEYLGPDAPVYHGEGFQTLRLIAINGAETLGRIAAPSPVELGGPKRPAHGWVLPCAVMDGMLYAAAVSAWRRLGRASLPVRFEEIVWDRLPDPGEPLWVRIRHQDDDPEGATLSLDLFGHNREYLMAVRGYRIHWLR